MIGSKVSPKLSCDLFEGWARSPAYDGLIHILDIDYRNGQMNSRMRAQTGVFIWWHPLGDEYPNEPYPFLVNGPAKLRIINELSERGVRTAILFPDAEGANWQEKLDLVTPRRP